MEAQRLEHAKELNKLRRERSHLEQQRRAHDKVPSRKDRAEVEALEAVVEQAKKDAKTKDARHKVTVERMRRQVVSLQVRVQIWLLLLSFTIEAGFQNVEKSCRSSVQDQCGHLKEKLRQAEQELEQLRGDLAKKHKRRAKADLNVKNAAARGVGSMSAAVSLSSDQDHHGLQIQPTTVKRTVSNSTAQVQPSRVSL